MVDLRAVFEWGENGFNEEAATQHAFVSRVERRGVHVGAIVSHKVDTRARKGGTQGLRQIAFVSKNLTEQPSDKGGYGLAVVTVSGGATEVEKLSLRINDQMQLETVEPAHRTLAALGMSYKHPVTRDAVVVTHRQRGRVDERNAVAASSTARQVSAQTRRDARHEANEAVVAD